MGFGENEASGTSTNRWCYINMCVAAADIKSRAHGPLSRYVKLRVAHAPGMPGTFYPPPRVSDPDMHHGTCVTHVPWCMPGSLTRGFLWSRWRGKRSRHSRRMRNPQFCASGKRPMGDVQGSDQFMNWIGIDNQFNSIQHELNWNWIERFWIGIVLELKAWTD